jgi:hypothetical protein
MTLDFNWWLLLVGLGFGAALTWLILADLGRREADLSARERATEVTWLADELAAEGRPVPDELVERALQLHAAYLRRARLGADDDPELPMDEDPGEAGEPVGSAVMVAQGKAPVAESESPVAESESPVAESESPVAESEPAPPDLPPATPTDRPASVTREDREPA